MKEFPPKLVPGNVASFPAFKYERDLQYFREAIYEFMLNQTAKYEEIFDLEAFSRIRDTPKEMLSKMIIVVKPELEKLGWKILLARKETVLHIYDAKMTPKNLSEW
jgi:hypothetical protein